jgi:hypothetical protein
MKKRKSSGRRGRTTETAFFLFVKTVPAVFLFFRISSSSSYPVKASESDSYFG